MFPQTPHPTLNQKNVRVLCQHRDAAVDFTWITVRSEAHRGALPWPALVRRGPNLAGAAMSSCLRDVAQKLAAWPCGALQPGLEYVAVSPGPIGLDGSCVASFDRGDAS